MDTPVTENKSVIGAHTLRCGQKRQVSQAMHACTQFTSEVRLVSAPKRGSVASLIQTSVSAEVRNTESSGGRSNSAIDLLLLAYVCLLTQEVWLGGVGGTATCRVMLVLRRGVCRLTTGQRRRSVDLEVILASVSAERCRATSVVKCSLGTSAPIALTANVYVNFRN